MFKHGALVLVARATEVAEEPTTRHHHVCSNVLKPWQHMAKCTVLFTMISYLYDCSKSYTAVIVAELLV